MNNEIIKIMGHGAADEKHRAMVQAALELIAERPASSFAFRGNVDNIPDDLLPALIAEASLEEFIEPGLSTHHIKRLYANRIDLHALKGFVIGTRMGLELLGMIVHWKQWFNMSPMGEAGTHEVTVFVNEHLFPDVEMLLSDKTQRQALRMIENTKRLSQHIILRLGINTDLDIAASAVGYGYQKAKSEAHFFFATNTDFGVSAVSYGGIKPQGEMQHSFETGVSVGIFAHGEGAIKRGAEAAYAPQTAQNISLSAVSEAAIIIQANMEVAL